MQAVDSAETLLEPVIRGADLVVLCTPLSEMRRLVDSFKGCLEPGAVVTDVGSVKATVVHELEPRVHAAGGRFVGSHPMAGSEQSGVAHARANLFEDAVAVVTPAQSTDPSALARVIHLWESIGSRVLSMPAGHHDTLVSRSSHLPHVIAAALAHSILTPGHPSELGPLCAGGFRDTTRVASGAPEMWRDIVLSNRAALLEALDGFDASVTELRSALRCGDGEAIHRFLSDAKNRRDAWKRRDARSIGE